jgi:hypothetical protein
MSAPPKVHHHHTTQAQAGTLEILTATQDPFKHAYNQACRLYQQHEEAIGMRDLLMFL